MDFVLFIASSRESGGDLCRRHGYPLAAASPAGLKGFSRRCRGNPLAAELRLRSRGCTPARDALVASQGCRTEGCTRSHRRQPKQRGRRAEHVFAPDERGIQRRREPRAALGIICFLLIWELQPGGTRKGWFYSATAFIYNWWFDNDTKILNYIQNICKRKL